MDSLIDQIVEVHSDLQLNEEATSSIGNQSGVKVSQIEKQVRERLSPLLKRINVPKEMERLTERGFIGQSNERPSKSLLPSVAGEHFSERIIADVVNQIASYANRETMIEGSVGQRQLMGSLERTVSQLVSKTRSMNIPSEVTDWVDVQPFGQSEEGDSSNIEYGGAVSKPSPWFTGPSTQAIQDTTNQSRFQLQPVQQAAARVLNMVKSNPTRPDVVARYTGLKVREIQSIVATLQGLDVPIFGQSSSVA